MAPPALDSTVPTASGMGPPSPLVVRVIEAASQRVGQHEEGGKNRGPIVVWSMEKWISEERLARYLETGKGEWCAGFASRCWLEAWPDFKAVGSGDCDVLWARCAARGWTYLRAHDQVDVPQPGDLIFFGRAGDLHHVEIASGYSVDKRVVHTIGGNTTATSDRVARRQRGLTSIFGWARVRPGEGA